MKLMNFRLNKNVVPKLVAYVMAGSFAVGALTGCDSKTEEKTERNNALSGTLLENACVITFVDGSKDIAVAVNECSYLGAYEHYNSVISGTYFSNKDCSHSSSRGYPVLNHFPIKSSESIATYLTPEELAKALQNDLTDEDVLNIASRIIVEDTESLVKKR